MSVPDITIPPEALEAARLAVAQAIIEDRDGIEAACLAMLKHWPEVGFVREDINTPVSYLVLPLTEPRTSGVGIGCD